MRKHVTLIVAGLALLWMTGSAGAGAVETWAYLTSTSQGLPTTVTYPVYDSSGVYIKQVSERTVVGIYQFTQVNTTAHPLNGDLDPVFYSFCMDLRQFVYYPSTINHWSDMRLLVLDGSDEGPWPGPHGQAMTLAQKTNLLKLFNLHYSDVSLSKTNAAAFGAGVWEIVWEDGYALNVKNGLVKVNMAAGAQDLANTWLGELAGYNPATYPHVMSLLDNTTQDQLAFIAGGSGEPPHTPEPVTMAGLMLGIGGLVTYVRKRRKA